MQETILYHGTSSEEFHTPQTPFHLTIHQDRAERFSLRGLNIGTRRILEYKIINNPRLFCYKNETSLEKECGQRIPDVEDSLRYAIIADLLYASDNWDGYYIPDLQWYCLFDTKFLTLINTEYLEEFTD